MIWNIGGWKAIADSGKRVHSPEMHLHGFDEGWCDGSCAASGFAVSSAAAHLTVFAARRRFLDVGFVDSKVSAFLHPLHKTGFATLGEGTSIKIKNPASGKAHGILMPSASFSAPVNKACIFSSRCSAGILNIGMDHPQRVAKSR